MENEDLVRKRVFLFESSTNIQSHRFSQEKTIKHVYAFVGIPSSSSRQPQWTLQQADPLVEVRSEAFKQQLWEERPTLTFPWDIAMSDHSRAFSAKIRCMETFKIFEDRLKGDCESVVFLQLLSEL